MIDLHIHILPGIDDGASNWDESLGMCRLCVADDTRCIAATAHMFDGMFNVSRRDLLESCERLNGVVTEEELDLDIKPAGEAHVGPDLLRRVNSNEVVTIGDAGRYLLVEFPRDVIPDPAVDVLFEIQLTGVTPVICHVARNREVQDNPQILDQFIHADMPCQVTAQSLAGGFSEHSEVCAKDLVAKGRAHLLASDAHSCRRRRPGLTSARDVINDLVEQDWAAQICDVWPRAIWDASDITLPEPQDRSIEKKSVFRFW